MLNHAQLREKRAPLKRTPLKHCLSTHDQHVVPRRYMSTRRRAVMRAFMTDSFCRGCPGHVSPYGMQHGSERRLLGRLLGPATMNNRSPRRPTSNRSGAETSALTRAPCRIGRAKSGPLMRMRATMGPHAVQRAPWRRSHRSPRRPTSNRSGAETSALTRAPCAGRTRAGWSRARARCRRRAGTAPPCWRPRCGGSRCT